MDSESLTARLPDPVVGMGCSRCHPYSLSDDNHFTHLVFFSGENVKQVNGPITCLDCHATSLQRTTVILLDSLYMDSAGFVWSSVDFKGVRPPGKLVRVDTIVQHHPIPSQRLPPAQGELQEWVTGLAHMNGQVDVVFDSTVSNPQRFGGARAEFNPKLETCSAVNCHVHEGAYRFEACSKGLPGLEGDSVPDDQCAVRR
ncbi:MAG: hypothetical protein JF616_00225 [Fibrobacteres bacterium]|nr:hypothetical protein [Fibrobacterota bacterium]